MRKYLCIFILIPALALAGPREVNPPDTVDINTGDLPYTITASNTAYRINVPTGGPQVGKLNSTTNGIYADAKHDIVIFGDFTGTSGSDIAKINFANGGGDSYYGIRLERCYNVRIQDVAPMINDNSNLWADSNNQLIILDRCDSIWITDNSLWASGIDAHAIRLVGTSRGKNIQITNNTGGTLSNWFTSRTAYGAAWLLADYNTQTPLDTAIGEYHVYCANNDILRSIHAALCFIGRDVEFGTGNYGGELAYGDSNLVVMAKRNDKYMGLVYPEGDSNTAHSAGDAYAFTLDGVRGGSHFNYNTVIRSTTEDSTYGGSGFLVQGAHGTLEYPVEFIGNQFTLSEGETPAFSSDLRAAANFFYVRRFLQTGSPSADSSYNKFCVFRNNNGINYVDTSTATKYIGRVYEGVRFGANSIYTETMVWENNHFECGLRTDVATTSPNGGATQIVGAALVYHSVDEVTTSRFIHNYWGGYDKVWSLFGSRIEAPANNLYSYRDTLFQRIDADSMIYFYPWSQATADHHINNVVIDATFLGYADPSKVEFTNCTNIDSLGKSIEFWQTLELLVLGSDGNPALLAGVWSSSAYEDRFLGFTDYQGWLRKPLKTRYEHFDCVSDAYNPGDSLSFEPRTLTVYSFLGTDTTQIVMTLMTQRIDTVQFNNEVGTEPPPRTYLMMRKINIPGDADWLVGPDAQ